MGATSKTLMPKLRFPEFREAEAWPRKPLGSLLKFGNGRDHKHLPDGNVPVYGSGGYMRSVSEHLYEGKSVCIGRKGTIDNPIFLTGRFWTVDTLFYTYDFNGCLPEFVYYLFHQIPWLDYSEAGGVPSLAKTTISRIAVPTPTRAEQQKIADCLTSLDEVIAAQGRKVEALKAHKKGLMQQLFPREGETLPRLRFPEFRDAPGWSQKTLGELSRFVRGPFGAALKKDVFVSEGYAVYEQSHAIDNQMQSFRYFITKDKFDKMKRFAVQPNDLIMSCSGTMGKFAKVPAVPTPGVINQALLKLTVLDHCDTEFLLLSLGLPAIQSKLLTQSAGGAIKNVVGVPQLKQIEISIPSRKEQGRIATFFSLLNATATAESAKLDALKLHKRGLMQQLFPAAEGD
jgi:type I restriction enzyme S subunit